MKYLIMTFCMLVVMNCTSDQVVGTTDETEHIIKGTVGYAAGNSAPNVPVKLFYPMDTTVVATTVSNDKGEFAFSITQPGTYAVWAESGDSVVATTGAFEFNARSTIHHHLTLTPGGSVVAFVTLPGKANPSSVRAYVPGTPRIEQADSYGTIRLSGLAHGTYSMHLSSGNALYEPLQKDFVITSGATDTLRDTLRFILRNPTQTVEYLHGIATGNGTTVVVGTKGTILYSRDAVHWETAVSGTDLDIYDVAWGNNTFISIADNGTMLKSLDGRIWSPPVEGYFPKHIMEENVDTLYCRKIEFTQNQFIVYDGFHSELGITCHSPDGEVWTRDSLHFYPEELVYNGSFFVATASEGMYSSPDLKSWTNISTLYLTDVHYTNNSFIAIRNSYSIDSLTLVVSADAQVWTDVMPIRAPGAYIVKGDSLLYMYTTGGSNPMVATSPNGSTWSSLHAVTGSLAANNIIWDKNKILWDGTKFIAAGGNGYTATSLDGINWENESSQADDITNIVWTGTEFVSVVRNGVLTSKNGTTWSKSTTTLNEQPSDLAWQNGTFVAGTFTGSLYTSTDGKHWNKCPAVSLQSVRSIAAGNGCFVAGCSRDSLYVSTDGSVWSAVPLPQSTNDTLPYHGINNVVLGYGYFVAFTSNGQVAFTSKDGFSWAIVDIPMGNTGTCVAAGDDMTIVATDLSLSRSTDGVTWSTSPLTTGIFLNLMWDGTQFVGLTSEAIFTSTNGTEWFRRGDSGRIPPGKQGWILDAASNGSSYVFVGYAGAIYSLDKFGNE